MDSAKEHSAAMPARSSKLRYPLRSAGKGRDGKPAGADASASSASRRGRDSSIVSKSVSVLDLSGKDESVKPPRRLSIPSKSAPKSPYPAAIGSMTPISEYRVKKSDSVGTPASDVSKSTSKKKFSVLSSASYWLSQIKLSESACKHSISLGFFKLAMESGCEPMQRVREEFKSYAVRHNVLELGETARELLQSYNILEEVENMQASQTDSHMTEETKSSDSIGCSPCARSGCLKPKSMNAEAPGVTKSTKKDASQRKFPAANNVTSHSRTPVNPGHVRDSRVNIQKKSQKPKNLNSDKDKVQGKSTTKISATQIAVPQTAEETPQENKENVDHQLMDESNSAVELQTN